MGSSNAPRGAVPPLLLGLVLGLLLGMVLGMVLVLGLGVELRLVPLLPVDVMPKAVVQLAEVRSKCSLRPMLP